MKKIFSSVFAQAPGGNTPSAGAPGGSTPSLNPEFRNPLAADTVMELIQDVIDILVAIGVPIAVLFLVYAGFLFVTARGSEEQIKKAKGILLWTIVGILILLGAKIIATVLQNTITTIDT